VLVSTVPYTIIMEESVRWLPQRLERISEVNSIHEDESLHRAASGVNNTPPLHLYRDDEHGHDEHDNEYEERSPYPPQPPNSDDETLKRQQKAPTGSSLPLLRSASFEGHNSHRDSLSSSSSSSTVGNTTACNTTTGTILKEATNSPLPSSPPSFSVGEIVYDHEDSSTHGSQYDNTAAISGLGARAIDENENECDISISLGAIFFDEISATHVHSRIRNAAVTLSPRHTTAASASPPEPTETDTAAAVHPDARLFVASKKRPKSRKQESALEATAATGLSLNSGSGFFVSGRSDNIGSRKRPGGGGGGGHHRGCWSGLVSKFRAFRDSIRLRALSWVSPNGWLEKFFLLTILLNSISMACIDYSNVDEDYQPLSETSVINGIIEKLEIVFTLIFLLETSLKAVAFGLIFNGPESYLRRDGWNVLDFFVTLASVVAMIPGTPNVTALRTLRLLRPLRSISKLEGVRNILMALAASMNDLANVGILLLFLIMTFAIMGVVFWRGLFHFRCRTTPYPIRLPPDLALRNCSSISLPCFQDFLNEVHADPAPHQCLPGISNNEELWSQSTSPWFLEGPQDCIWPIDNADKRICSADGSGRYQCPSGGVELSTTCGSNYDNHGNPRFVNSLNPYGYDRMLSDIWLKQLNWGFTTFDNFGAAFLSTFQLVTLEGWSDILYYSMDASLPLVAIFTFTILVTIGGFILVNLVLAVISGALDKIQTETQGGEAEMIRKTIQKRKSSMSVQRLKTLRSGGGNQKLLDVVCSPLFEAMSMGCIIFNTIILSLDHYGISEEYSAALEIVNLVLTALFAIEMVFCMAAYSPSTYFADSSSQLDFVIVIISLVETAVIWLFGSGASSGFSVFRSLRVFRIFKLAKQWKSLNGLLDTMNETFQEIGSFVFLLLLFIFIFALLGMQFFSNRFRFDMETDMALSLAQVQALEASVSPEYASVILPYAKPRSNFDSFGLSVLTVFQILTGENWNAVMYDAWRAGGWTSTLYFVLVVVLGMYVVMNLFLAMLINKFEGNDKIMRYGEKRAKKSRARGFAFTLFETAKRVTRNMTKIKTQRKHKIHNDSGAGCDGEEELDDAEHELAHDLPASSSKVIDIPPEHSKDHDGGGSGIDSNDHESESSEDTCWEWFRSEVAVVVDSPYFERTVLVCIGLNCISLALDSPLNDPQSIMARCIRIFDMIFLTLFALEAIMKIVVQGFLLEENAYLRNGWNCADFFIVLAAFFDLAKLGPGKALRALRAVRVLRPIRMIRRVPELKLVVDALIMAIPSVANVAAICFLFFLMFSIFGVTYLKGTLWHCKGAQFSSLTHEMQYYLTFPTPLSESSPAIQTVLLAANGTTPTCHSTRWLEPLLVGDGDGADSDSSFFTPTSRDVCECVAPEEWTRVRSQNFDSVPSAMQLFFELSTTEGWVDVMHAVVDHTSVHMQPLREHQWYWAIFFVLFVQLGAFFVVELFTGAIIQNFNTIREQSSDTGGALMTPKQRQWITTKNFVAKIKPELRVLRPPERQPVSRWCYDFVMPNINPRFEEFTTFLIIVSSLCTGLVAFGDSDDKTRILGLCNAGFVVLFVMELILKVTAMKRGFFQSGWNIFDCCVVTGSAIGLIANAALPDVALGPIASLIRLTRVIRLFRLVKKIKSLRVIFNTMAASLPSIVNIGALLLLLFFIYAVCGVQLFSTMAYNHEGLHNEQANFRNLGNAMLLLLRFSTGENWNGFMRSLMVDAADCVDDPYLDETAGAGERWCVTDADYPDCVEVNGCGSSDSMSIFFYFDTFTLCVSFVVLNLFVGVVLNAYERSKEGDILSVDDLDCFIQAWGDYDPNATWRIPQSKLREFLVGLPAPMGFGPPRISSGGNTNTTTSRTTTKDNISGGAGGEESLARQIPMIVALTDEEVTENMRACGLFQIKEEEGHPGTLGIVPIAQCLAKRVAKEELGESFEDFEFTLNNMSESLSQSQSQSQVMTNSSRSTNRPYPSGSAGSNISRRRTGRRSTLRVITLSPGGLVRPSQH
jgi:voltage-dependent calcium channel L type alpha-1D